MAAGSKLGTLPDGAVFDFSPGKTHRGALWVKTAERTGEGWIVIHPYVNPNKRMDAKPVTNVYRRKGWEM